MRKLLAAVVTAGLMVSMLGPSLPAAADAAPLVAASATEPGWNPKIQLRAISSHPITQLKAELWSPADTTRPFATITDFVLVTGTEDNGIWLSRDAVRLELGRLRIDAEVTDASGAHVVKASAGTIDNRVAPRFVSFNVSPTTLSIANNGLTYSGRLVYTDADGVEQPAVDQSIAMVNPGGGSVNSYGRTDADGWFTATGYPRWQTPEVSMLSGRASASFGGSLFFLPNQQAPSVHINVQQQPTRLVITSISSPRTVGDPLNVSGKLEWQRADGQWLGLNNQPVGLVNKDVETGVDTAAEATTGADASFVLAMVATYPGSLTLSYSGLHRVWSDTDFPVLPGPYRAARIDIKPFNIKYRTSIANFAVRPANLIQGAAFSLTGTVRRASSDGLPIPAPEASVDIQFSADGSHWSTVTRTKADRTGAFTVRRTATRTGYWRAVTPETSTNYSASSKAVRLPVKLKARFFSFNASPEPVRQGRQVTVSGRLTKLDNSQYRPLGGQRVVIQFRPRGSSTWQVRGTATTGPQGWLNKKVTAHKDGTWRLFFAPTASYLAATSSGDYIDVR